MSLSPGVRLGPYEIVSAIGAGGMGEVYRAKDTRLDRTVAIKVLPAHLAADPDRRARFEREARAVSSLNHPHICALYDVGHEDSLDFLVMEHLEGETLADRLRKGPLPLDLALRTGIEIAEALDKAHRHGVVHRDLKPANVMMTKSGAKLLDFGLAKATAIGGADGLSAMPTAEKPLTEAGTILGTFQYMAPEQLEGGEADARTDIFTFGSVLYEMLTGTRAFAGKSQASLISAIMTSEPAPVGTLQPMTPPALDRLVRTCLAKDPDGRWQSAGDVARELKWIVGGAGTTIVEPVAGQPRPRGPWRWAMLGAALGAIIVAAALVRRGTAPAPAPVRLTLLPPKDVSRIEEIALSPDSRRLAFTDGDHRLFILKLDGGPAQTLAGVKAFDPFWSPDGRFIAYFSRGQLGKGQLMKVDVDGGPPQTLCEAHYAGGGAWSREGVILFGDWQGPLQRVDEGGGKPTLAVGLDPARHEAAQMWPSFLPDGRHFLYLGGGDTDANRTLRVGSLDSKESLVLSERFFSEAFYASGRLLFVRGGNLMSQPFDPVLLKFTGEATPIATHVAWKDRRYYTFFADPRLLVFLTHDPSGPLRWLDRTGRVLSEAGTAADTVHLDLSPDDSRVAMERVDAERDNGAIWILDLKRGSESRLTLDSGWHESAIWSPDGDRLAFWSPDHQGMYAQSVNGSGPAELLLKTLAMPQSWSPDGRHIAYETAYETGDNGADISVLPLFGDRKPFSLANTPFWENGPQFSPDGRFIAYQSQESGRVEVYVQPFPPTGTKSQVSRDGGYQPRWRRDGRELFYIGARDLMLTAVDVRLDGGFQAGMPKPLFKASFKDFRNRSAYAVSRDGQRFLVNTEEPEATLTVIVDWRGEPHR